MPNETFVPPTKESYTDEDLVYVDPEKRVVVGLVQWSNAGRPKALVMRYEEKPEEVDAAAPAAAKPKGRPVRRPRRERMYPWGTYRSMKRLYKLEGKVIEERPSLPLEEAIAKCQEQPFWD